MHALFISLLLYIAPVQSTVPTVEPPAVVTTAARPVIHVKVHHMRSHPSLRIKPVKYAAVHRAPWYVVARRSAR